MAELGVNVDHVATLRQARGCGYPDPVEAAFRAESAGAVGITVHLREDRRHIQERDVRVLRETVRTKLNLEMANVADIVQIALEIRPEEVCLVPEKRTELTTEGGLQVCSERDSLADTIKRMHDCGIAVSLFIEPDLDQVAAAAEISADMVELHTGKYANQTLEERTTELEHIRTAAQSALSLGMKVNAGHGLNLNNVGPIAVIEGMGDLNIGHSIVARAVMVGFEKAVSEMVTAIYQAR